MDGSSVQHIRGIGHECSRVQGSVQLTIDLGPEVTVKHRFSVVSKTVMPFCFLFGMDFLTTHAITLDLDAQYCLVGGVMVPFTGGEDNIGVVGYLEPATTRDDCGGLLRNPEDRSAGPLG